MHPLAKRHFEKVLGKGELLGIDKSCKYYPCHHGGLEDCTFCFCPFYPCGDESTGGKWIKVTTWSCEDCSWIHRTEVASRVLKEIKELGINKPEDIDKNWISLNKIRERVKALYPLQSGTR
jgi:precorrin-3B C17-methyltransferase